MEKKGLGYAGSPVMTGCRNSRYTGRITMRVIRSICPNSADRKLPEFPPLPGRKRTGERGEKLIFTLPRPPMLLNVRFPSPEGGRGRVKTDCIYNSLFLPLSNPPPPGEGSLKTEVLPAGNRIFSIC